MLANTEGDPLHEGGVDVPAIRSQHGIDGLQGAKHDAVSHPHQATAAYGLDDLRVEQLWEWHPTWLGGRAMHLPARWLHPLPIVRQQGRQILPKSVGEKQRGTVGGQDLNPLTLNGLRDQCTPLNLSHMTPPKLLSDRRALHFPPLSSEATLGACDTARIG